MKSRRPSDQLITRSGSVHRSDGVADIQPDPPGLHGERLGVLVEGPEGNKEVRIRNPQLGTTSTMFQSYTVTSGVKYRCFSDSEHDHGGLGCRLEP